jgi:hypothetical protein
VSLVVRILTLIAATESKTDTDSLFMDYSIPMTDSTEIARLQESLKSAIEGRHIKHTDACLNYEKECQAQGMMHLGIAEEQAKPCTCSCHKDSEKSTKGCINICIEM